MTSQRKPIWKILCSKSESEVTKAKTIFETIRLRRVEAASRKLKLQNMAHEYTQKLNDVLKKAHTKHEASNYRQFMVQLQKLLVFADSDLKQIELELGVARKNLVNAENENMKSQTDWGGLKFLLINRSTSFSKGCLRLFCFITIIRFITL